MNTICFCADSTYVSLISVVLTSLCDNDPNRYRIYILTDEKSFPEAKGISADFSGRHEVHVLQADVHEFEKLRTYGHFTKGIFYRLRIPDLIKDDWVLYLDCDIIVNGDISGIFQSKNDSCFVSAVDNPFFCRAHELNIDSAWGYFNSGVMLINNALWRAKNIKEEVTRFIDSHSGTLFAPDQDALNAVFKGNWKPLSITYNAQTSMYRGVFKLSYPKEELASLKHPRIIHYSTSSKPWHHSDAHVFKHIFVRYYRQSAPRLNRGPVRPLRYLYRYLTNRAPFRLWSILS